MSLWSPLPIALAALTGLLAMPTEAQAHEPTASVTAESEAPTPRRKRPRVRAVEIQGLAMAQLLPRTGLGGDIAFVFGVPNFQARLGAQVVGVPGFDLGQGEVGNLLHTGTLDLCAAKPVLRHQIRMCVGGQAGGMSHFWKGYEAPGRRMSPWGAGTLKGDYQLSITDRFGVIGGVGMVLPVVGPSFRSNGAHATVFPGPMSGYLSLGTTFRW